MFCLSHENKAVITLGELRQFLNKDCLSLSDDIPVTLSTLTENDVNVECNNVLADDESITFYNY